MTNDNYNENLSEEKQVKMKDKVFRFYFDLTKINNIYLEYLNYANIIYGLNIIPDLNGNITRWKYLVEVIPRFVKYMRVWGEIDTQVRR